jgi:hypothetical protein
LAASIKLRNSEQLAFSDFHFPDSFPSAFLVYVRFTSAGSSDRSVAEVPEGCQIFLGATYQNGYPNCQKYQICIFGLKIYHLATLIGPGANPMYDRELQRQRRKI